MVIAKGVSALVESGHIKLGSQYLSVSRAVDLHKSKTTRPSNLEGPLLHEWHYGPAGVGKTSSVYETYPKYYPKQPNKWWCGYNDEETVVIDDLQPSHMAHMVYFLKLWADRYIFEAQSKGGSRIIRPLRIVVTSQYSIREILTKPDLTVDTKELEALTRRFRSHKYYRPIQPNKS